MSVLFLPPPSASAIPDASETVSGKIRIATSAEATAGTNDLTAMTPAKVKSVVDTAVVGGVTYKGTFDASAPLDLSNAEQGDLYVIDGAGTYQGIVWAVGDHLLVNADMGGTVDPNKIDKIDSTDSVTSVAGRTGAVTLSTADISGLATVASTGAYSDLTGTPTLATVATTGAYSDLSGTPTLGTASAEDVGTLAGNVVQLDGSAKLPAIDGSQLTNLPNGTLFYNTQIASLGPTLTQIADNRRQHYDIALANPANPITLPSATSAAIGGVVNFFNSQATGQAVINCPSTRLLSGSSVTSFTVEPSEARSFVWVGTSSLQEITATRLESFNGVSISSPSNGEALVYNGTSGEWENSTVSASVAALDDIGDVSAAAPSNTNVIKYNSTSGDWESGAVAASEVSGLATVAATGAYSDLSGTPTNVSTFTNDAGYLTEANSVVLQYNSTTTATAVSTKDLHVYRLYGAGGFTLTVSSSVSNSLVLINNISGSACTISGPTFRRNGEGVAGGVTSITVEAGERRLFYLESSSLWLETNATLLDRLAGVSITSPSNGEALIYNSTSGDWENGTVSASVAALNDIGDVSAAAPSNTNVIKYNSTSGDWESGAVAYSEVTGTPTLATVATTGAYSDLTGTPTNVSTFTNDAGYLTAITGESVGDLSDVTLTTPSAGQSLVYNGTLSVFENATITATVSALNDIGDVSAASPNNGDVIAYNSTSGDWEATAQSGGGSAPSVTVSSPSADQTLTTPSGIEEVYIYTPSTAINVNLVAAATCGSGFKYQIKNMSSNVITIDPNSTETVDGSSTFSLSAQYESVTLLTDGSNWFVI